MIRQAKLPICRLPHCSCCSTVALGGHCPGLASSHLRIFASSWHCMGRYCGGCRSITSSHLRIFSSPDFLKPSPQLRIFGSSDLRLSRFSETLPAASHLRIFATSALQIFCKLFDKYHVCYYMFRFSRITNNNAIFYQRGKNFKNNILLRLRTCKCRNVEIFEDLPRHTFPRVSL